MADLRITSQVELATASGLTKSEINALLQGRVKLPGPEKRKGLAKALGVSHLDLLIAAGEITEAEIEDAGKAGVVTLAPDDPRAQLHALIDELEPRRVPFALHMGRLIRQAVQDQW